MEAITDSSPAPARPAPRPGTLGCPQCGAPVEFPTYADGAVCAFCGAVLTRSGQPGAAPGKQGETQRLRSVQCSQCAGPLDAYEGRRILVCAHCGVRFDIVEHGGFSRWHFPCRVTRVQAAEAGARWLADFPGIEPDARTGRLVEARLLYAPIWEYRSFIAGWEFGDRVTVVNEPVQQGPATWFDTRVVRENIKEPHLQERRFFLEATDFGTFGATRPRLTGRELLLPMFAGEIEPNASVLETTSDREKFAQMGRAACLAPVSGAGWADDHAFCLRESTALLYYPMWVLGFEQGNRVSHIVVDGRDGSINAGVAPAANGRRVALLAAQVAFLAILAVIFIWFAATWQQGRDSLVALAVIVSVAAIVIVWRFRPVREVEYHEPFSS